MPIASIIFGLLLCGLTVVGMVGSVEKLATAFVPMMFGIPLVIAGIISLNPHRGRVWVPVAALIAGIGLVVSAGCAGVSLNALAEGKSVNLFALQLVIALAGLLALFLIAWLITLWRNRSGWRRRRGQLEPATRPSRPKGARRVDIVNPS